MASMKMFLVLASLLLACVFAHPNVDYTIHSIKVLPDDAEIDIDDGITVTDDDSLEVLDRAPREKAVSIIKKFETGFARTTRVGITVQKGTYGRIHFRIRLKAITTEKLALKAKIFAKSLTKEQKKELRKLSKDYSGGFDIPWLKFLGIDLSKKFSEKTISKAQSKTINFNKLALKAKLLLKETVAQKIEVRGTLTAHGVSFIPTTVFSFIRIAKVYFDESSKLLVLSKHSGDVKAATSGGSVVPSETEDIEILDL